MNKVKYIKVGQAPKRRRVSLWTWLARLNGWTVAWYAVLTVAGALLLPVLYYVAAMMVRDFMRDWKDGRFG